MLPSAQFMGNFTKLMSMSDAIDSQDIAIPPMNICVCLQHAFKILLKVYALVVHSHFMT